MLGRRRSHFSSLFWLSFWKPPPSRPEEPFWLSASATDISQELPGLPGLSVLHTERLRLNTLSPGSPVETGLKSASESWGLEISPQAEALSWVVFMPPNPETFHRGIPRGGGLRPGVTWKEARPGQGWAGHSWCLWGGCVACLGSDQGQECGAGCLESWHAF